MGEIVNAMDRISKLPPFIVHHIMSYLSAKEVARINVLSKTWRYLSISYPFLDFDQTYFVLEDINHINLPYWSSNKTVCKRLKRFTKFVDGSLDRFCKTEYSMQRFRLFTSLVGDPGSSFRLHRWIRLAVEKGVKELDLNVVSAKITLYSLPRIIFDAELLTTLKLVGCRINEPFDTIRLPSLKKLTLERVSINEKTIQRLTTECPFLEDLSFSCCSGLKHLCVSEPLKLKILRIRLPSDIELESVEIAAQSLQILDLFFSRVLGPQVIDIASCPNLQKVYFKSVNLTDQEFSHLISKFHLLEALYVSGCASIERINISSNRLKILQFSNCPKLKAIDVDTPNLLSFSYSKNPVPTSSINAPCPWMVAFNNEGDPDTPWFLNIKEFLSDSNQIKDLRMNVKAEQVSFNVDKFRESSSSLPCEVGNLSLYVDVPRSDYVALLDGLLCVCYPKTLSVPTSRETRRKFIEWLYEELMNRDKNCCISHHMKCWRHYLKALRIESCKPFKNPEPVDVNNLMEVWSRDADVSLLIHLDWGFHVPTENS